MSSLPTTADFEKEAVQASNLYVTAQNIRDKGASDSVAKVTTTQFLELEKEKTHLEKELRELKQELTSYERDFLDQRAEKGEVITTMPATLTLQDSALSIFAFAWILFAVILVIFAFMPPLGNVKTGTYTLIGIGFVSLIIWGLIYNYA